MIGEATVFIAAIVASRPFMPFSIFTWTASTTTMASSTTSPIASTSPSSEKTLIENPNSGKTIKAPISETGIAISGTIVARMFCRKR